MHASSVLRQLVPSVFAVAMGAALPTLAADQPPPTQPIAVNQTEGFGAEQLLAFTYFMNFDCVHGPFDDFDKNGKAAAIDPDQFQTADPKPPQTSNCVVGVDSALDPRGKPASETEKLFVIVPFFDRGGEANSPALTAALKSLFGFVPEAFNPTPTVAVQCPEPGGTRTQHKGDFGTCTMHPKQLDLGPVLGSTTPINVPLPNHSHIIDGGNFGAIWWRIVVVLINDASFWPDADGISPSGQTLNSVKDLRAVQAAGKATADIPSNFFLFFDSRKFGHGGH